MWVRSLLKTESYKTFFHYLFSNIGFAIISLLSGYFTYKFIGPESVGLWATILLIDIYSKFMRFGVLNGLGRELPLLLGRGDVERAHRLANISLSFNVAVNSVLIVFIPLSVWYLGLDVTNILVIVGLIGVVIKILINSLSNVYSLTFRTNNDFAILAKIKWIQGLMKIIGIAPIIMFGFYGLVIRDILIALVDLIFMRIWRPFAVYFTSNWSGIKSLITVGLPLFSSTYIISIAENIPKLYIAREANAIGLGLVSPVFMILGFIMIIPDAVSSFLYPRLTFRFGEKKSGGTRKYFCVVQNFSILLSFSVGCIMAFLVFIFSDKVAEIIPRYQGVDVYIRACAYCMPFLGWKINGFILSIFNKRKFIFLNSVLYLIIFLLMFYFLDMLIDEALLVGIYGMACSMGLIFVTNNLLVRRVIIANTI